MPRFAEGQIAKVDDERRLVFGWASVVTKQDGEAVLDSQDDLLDLASLEDAAYRYVLDSRDGGEMHEKRGVARLVESMIVTPEKLAKLGLAEDALPTGWWVGFRVDDDEVWKAVKDGTYRMFSIHGTGTREET